MWSFAKLMSKKFLSQFWNLLTIVLPVLVLFILGFIGQANAITSAYIKKGFEQVVI